MQFSFFEFNYSGYFQVDTFRKFTMEREKTKREKIGKKVSFVSFILAETPLLFLQLLGRLALVALLLAYISCGSEDKPEAEESDAEESDIDRELPRLRTIEPQSVSEGEIFSINLKEYIDYPNKDSLRCALTGSETPPWLLERGECTLGTTGALAHGSSGNYRISFSYTDDESDPARLALGAFQLLVLATKNPPVTPPITPPITPPVIPPVTPPITPPVTPPVNPPITPPINGLWQPGDPLFEDPYSRDSSGAGQVVIGDYAIGSFYPADDRDWFSIHLRRGFAYIFTLEALGGVPGQPLPDYIQLVLYNEKEEVIDYEERASSSSLPSISLSYLAQKDGTHYLRAAELGNPRGIGVYKIAAQEREDDYPEYITTEGRLALEDSSLEASIEGAIHFAGDKDWIAVQLAANQHYLFELKNFDQGVFTLKEPNLNFYYKDGSPFPHDIVSGYSDKKAYIAENGDTYYVEISSYDSDVTGSYSLVLKKAEADDYRDDSETTGILSVGGSVNGAIQFYEDVDWFAIDLDSAQEYVFEVEGRQTGKFTLDGSYLEVKHPQHDYYDSAGNFRVLLQPQSTSRHYIAVKADFLSLGSYRLVARLASEVDDISNEISGALSLSVGGHGEGQMQYYADMDWFYVDLSQGKTYSFTLEALGASATSQNSFQLNLYQDSDITDPEARADASGYGSHIAYTAQETKRHYLQVSAADFYSASSYRVEAQEVLNDELHDTGSSLTLAIGGEVTGEIDFPGDRDWYRVTAPAGQDYHFQLTPSEGSSLLQRDLELALYDEEGNLEADSHACSQATFQKSYTPPRYSKVFSLEGSRTYYVEVKARYGTGIGSYNLSATSVTADDYRDYHDDETISLVRATVGTVQAGNIETPCDQDFFRFALQKDRFYLFEVEGVPLGVPDSTFHLSSVTSSNPFTTLVLNPTDGFGNRRLYQANQTEDYGVTVMGPRYGATGSYQFSISEVNDDYQADIRTTGSVAVGDFVTGNFDAPIDEDWFAVDLEAGQVYTFMLESLGEDSFSPLNSDILLYDALGDPLYDASGDPLSLRGHRALKSYLPSVAGQYYVAAFLREETNIIGSYRLSVMVGTEDDVSEALAIPLLTIGSSREGALQFYGDYDSFHVELQKGNIYTLEIMGAGGGFTSEHFKVDIYYPNGKLISQAIGSRLVKSYIPEESLTYTVTVSSDNNSSYTGNYRLQARQISDDYATGREGAGDLAVDSNINASIDFAGDQDWFVVDLVAGHTYSFQMTSTNLQEKHLALFEETGLALLEHNTLSGALQLSYTPSSTGSYYIVARGGSESGIYNISVDQL